MILGAVKRILKVLLHLDMLLPLLQAEKAATVGGIPDVRNKILTTLVATLSPVRLLLLILLLQSLTSTSITYFCYFFQEVREVLLDFIFDDLTARADLAFSWLFEEYCFYQNFSTAPTSTAATTRQPQERVDPDEQEAWR